MITDTDQMVQAMVDAKKLILRRREQCTPTVGVVEDMGNILKAIEGFITKSSGGTADEQ